MNTPRVTRARALAAQLTAEGLPATVDPGQVAHLAPCVLIGPPPLSFDGYSDAGTATWRLLLVAGTTSALQAWEQIDDLLEQLTDQLVVERAEPVQFQAPTGGDPLPAYAVTITETVE